MATNNEVGSHGFTTAEFRKYMAEVFEAARFRDAIVEVSHHGKPWVSIMSPENADFVRKLREIGTVEAQEMQAIFGTVNSPIGVHELVLRISEARSQRTV